MQHLVSKTKKSMFAVLLVLGLLIAPLSKSQASIYFLTQENYRGATFCFIGSAVMWIFSAPFSSLFLLGLGENKDSEVNHLTGNLLKKYTYLDRETAKEIADLILEKSSQKENFTLIKATNDQQDTYLLNIERSELEEIITNSRNPMSTENMGLLLADLTTP